MLSKLQLGKSNAFDVMIMRVDDVSSPKSEYQRFYIKDTEGDEIKATSFLERTDFELPTVKKLTIVAEEYKKNKAYRVIAIADSDVEESKFKPEIRVSKEDYKKFLSKLEGLRENLKNIVYGVINRDKDFLTVPLNPAGEEFSNPCGMLEATLKLVKLCETYPDDTLDKQLMIAAAALYFIGASNYITKDGEKTKNYHLLGPTYGLIQKFDRTMAMLKKEGKEVDSKDTTLLLHILLGANDINPSIPEAICVQKLAKTVTETEKAVKALAFVEEGDLVIPEWRGKNYYIKVNRDECES